jgi:hypothetical protein
MPVEEWYCFNNRFKGILSQTKQSPPLFDIGHNPFCREQQPFLKYCQLSVKGPFSTFPKPGMHLYYKI